jgi:hypothetical protein
LVGIWNNRPGQTVANKNRSSFEQRVSALKNKADPRTRVEKRVTEDGLVVTVAKTNGAKRSLIPIKGILIAAVLFVAVKGFLLAEIGEPEYLERLAVMKEGSAIQVSAAFLLDADPATRSVASFLNKTLN